MKLEVYRTLLEEEEFKHFWEIQKPVQALLCNE